MYKKVVCAPTSPTILGDDKIFKEFNYVPLYVPRPPICSIPPDQRVTFGQGVRGDFYEEQIRDIYKKVVCAPTSPTIILGGG